MSAQFERWKRTYNRKLSTHGVPENEHTDKMARVYYSREWSASAAAYDEMQEYIEYKRELRRQDELWRDTFALARSPATVLPGEVTERATQEENT